MDKDKYCGLSLYIYDYLKPYYIYIKLFDINFHKRKMGSHIISCTFEGNYNTIL